MIIFLIVPWFVAVATAFILKNIYMKNLPGKSKLLHHLVEKNWFAHAWKNGMLLFFSNLGMSMIVLAMFIVIAYSKLSFLFIIAMAIGIVLTIVVWIVFHSLWNGSSKQRFTSALIGSSYYVIIIGILLLYILQSGSGTIGGETTTSIMVSYIAVYVSIIAGSMCLVVVGLPSTFTSIQGE